MDKTSYTNKEIFKNFLIKTNTFIDFNGEDYTLADKSNNILTVTKNPEEMLQFILGYNKSTASLSEEISRLQETINLLNTTNKTNIENYEKIILDMGGDSIKGEDINESE